MTSEMKPDSTDGVQKPLFQDLNADDEAQQVTEIESLCFNCHEQGITRLMLTRIPFFREVILSSFSCEHCNYTDTDVQYGGKIQDKGIKCEVLIKNTRDLNRQVVKSASSTFIIPSLEFEQPPSKKAEINTVEGLINAVVRGLEQEQPVRKAMTPDMAEKIDKFIARLEELKQIPQPFKIILDDPSGNSFIENPYVPQKDEATTVHHYKRSAEQNEILGIEAETDTNADKSAEGEENLLGEQSSQQQAVENVINPTTIEHVKKNVKPEDLKDEVLSFPTNCPSCNSPCDTKMKVVQIPFFKQVIIMATTCDACGNRENEVKSGTGIEDKGTRITLKVTDPSDLNRDVLKSDTCGVKIPDVELELVEGTLGGRFTTVEGLLCQIKDELKTKNPFFMGDGAAPDTKVKLTAFLEKLDKLISGEQKQFTLILDDPAGNSYLQNLYAPDDDPNMNTEQYIRNDEQNDTLGLLEMKTENYTENS